MTNLQRSVPYASGMASISNSPSINLFFGEATPAQARVYARCENAADRLEGYLTGPECDFARTLPAHIPFADRSHGPTLLAEAIVPDPCFWTPELPFVYQAKLELKRQGETLANGKRMFGIRRLAVRDRTLQFEGKRFVLRGVRWQTAEGRKPKAEDNIETVAAFSRETWTAIVAPQPTDELCELASRRGMLLVADLVRAGLSEPGSELRRLAQWPAVGIALLNADVALPAAIRSAVPNLLLAEYVSNHPSLRLSDWAQLAFVEVNNPVEFAKTATGCNVPIVAVRSEPQPTAIEQARTACDTLQSEVAPHGDFAGYIA